MSRKLRALLLFLLSLQSRTPTRRPFSFRERKKTSVKIATFTGGSFWGMEINFLSLLPLAKRKGVLKTSVGFTGGNATSPTYSTVDLGSTGHAQALRIEYDSSVISYAELVEHFFRTHDPTQLDRQGECDIGTQFRSVIFTHSLHQLEIAQKVAADVQARYFTSQGRQIVTQIVPAGQWWEADSTHQQYLTRNPGSYQCETHRLHW